MSAPVPLRTKLRRRISRRLRADGDTPIARQRTTALWLLDHDLTYALKFWTATAVRRRTRQARRCHKSYYQPGAGPAAAHRQVSDGGVDTPRHSAKRRNIFSRHRGLDRYLTKGTEPIST
jgi:hypothetical protein